MPLFEYTAKNAQTGQIMKGQREAQSQDDVVRYIRNNRMILVNIREAPKTDRKSVV